MKNLFVSVLAVFSLVNFAHANDLADLNAETVIENVADPRLAGGWKSVKPVYNDKNVAMYLGMRFNEDTADMSVICQFKAARKVLEASVRVPVSVVNGQIEVLGRGEAEVKDGNFDCSVQMEEGTVSYTFVGKTLRLTSEGQVMDFAARK